MDKTILRSAKKLAYQRLHSLWVERKSLPFGSIQRAQVALKQAEIKLQIAQWNVGICEIDELNKPPHKFSLAY